MKKIKLYGSWLTVNRYCNFKCLWCYAKETGYRKKDEMELDLAKNLIDLEKKLEIRDVIFVGGEPTFWKYLFETNDYVKKKKMSSCLVTNGFLFSNKRFMEKIAKSPFDSISVSLKAGDAIQHKKLTDSDTFEKVLSGLRNLRKNNYKFGVSITLNPLVANNLDEVIKIAIDNGAKDVGIEFCTPAFKKNIPYQDYMMNPDEIVKCILHHYQTIDRYTKGKLIIQQSLPFCLWPSDFLNTLKKKNQIVAGCHVLRKEGLIFDPQGRLIPCNVLCDCALGQYGVDFNDVKSFLSFWAKPEIAGFYKQIIAYPSHQCIGCSQYEECGGGYPLQWFVFKPKEIIPKRR